MGKVIPVYKKGSPSRSNNYWPISILQIMSKVFEGVMKAHVSGYIEGGDLFLYSVWFCNGKLTTTATEEGLGTYASFYDCISQAMPWQADIS